jgi:hypothetical protein
VGCGETDVTVDGAASSIVDAGAATTFSRRRLVGAKTRVVAESVARTRAIGQADAVVTDAGVRHRRPRAEHDQRPDEGGKATLRCHGGLQEQVSVVSGSVHHTSLIGKRP